MPDDFCGGLFQDSLFNQLRFAVGAHGANDVLDIFLELVLGRAGDAPDVVLVFERLAEFVEITDVIHPQAFAEIDLGHAGFDAFGNVGHRNAAGAVLNQRRFDGFADFGDQFEIQPVLFLEYAVSAAVGDGEEIHVHFEGKFFGFGHADFGGALVGIIGALDDMADFGLHADAERPDEVDDLLRAADVFIERFVGVINHDVIETGADSAHDGLRGFAVVERDANRNGRIRGEEFDDRSGLIIAAIFEVRLILGDDERRFQFLARPR